MSKRKARKGLPTVLDPEEIKALKDVPNPKAPTGCRNRAILEVMHKAGLRVSEVCNLKPSHIRWPNGKPAQLEVKRGKGQKDRNIPLDGDTVAWLRAWDAIRPSCRFFFATLKSGKLSPRYLQAMCKRLANRAGVDPERVTPHVFRHSYATELLEEGFTLREVQVLLGHANVATTQTYLHVRDGTLAEKVAARGGKAAANAETAELARKIAGLDEDARAALKALLE